MYKLEFKKAAIKALMKMPTNYREAVNNELAKVASDPCAYQDDWRGLKGSPYHRLRVGRYRVICELVDDKLVMWVLKVGARGDIYK